MDGLLVVSCHLLGKGISVVMAVVGNEAVFACMFKSSDFAEEF